MNHEMHTEGAALRPLSQKQIHVLILLAREAFDLEFPPSEESFNEWRHRQCLLVCERPGLTAARNEDFLLLKAHFLKLCGKTEESEKALTRQAVEPRTWVLAKLQAECSAAADVMPAAWAYACGFVRNKRHVAIEDADDKTLWHAVYTVRNRAAQLRRKAS